MNVVVCIMSFKDSSGLRRFETGYTAEDLKSFKSFDEFQTEAIARMNKNLSSDCVVITPAKLTDKFLINHGKDLYSLNTISLDDLKNFWN